MLWIDPTFTAPIFFAGYLLLAALDYYSFICVAANTVLFVLGITCGLRLGVKVMVQMLQQDLNDPLRCLDLLVPQLSLSTVYGVVREAVPAINDGLVKMHDLVSAKDLLATAKFGGALWLSIQIDAWLNLVQTFKLLWVSAFTGPKLYVNNEDIIKDYYQSFRDNVKPKDFLRNRLAALLAPMPTRAGP